MHHLKILRIISRCHSRDPHPPNAVTHSQFKGPQKYGGFTFANEVIETTPQLIFVSVANPDLEKYENKA